MTILRSNPDAISNYFHRLIDGIGKRGSSFTNIDAVTHDLDTKRFLFQEFKRETEPLCAAQRWALEDLAALPRCMVWVARVIGPLHGGNGTPNTIELEVIGNGGPRLVSEAEYRRLFTHWWTNPVLLRAAPQCRHRPEFIEHGVCWICSHAGTERRA